MPRTAGHAGLPPLGHVKNAARVPKTKKRVAATFSVHPCKKVYPVTLSMFAKHACPATSGVVALLLLQKPKEPG